MCWAEMNLLSTCPELLGSSVGVNLPNIDVYGHITLNTPVLVRSLKLSKVELC